MASIKERVDWARKFRPSLTHGDMTLDDLDWLQANLPECVIILCRRHKQQDYHALRRDLIDDIRKKRQRVSAWKGLAEIRKYNDMDKIDALTETESWNE